MAIRKRRRFPRARVDRPAMVRLLQREPGQEPFEGFAKARVLGAGGCMVESPVPLGYAALTDVLISLGDRVIRADGRVVWEAEKDEGRHAVGMEFLRISAEDRVRIESLIAREQRSQGADAGHSA